MVQVWDCLEFPGRGGYSDSEFKLATGSRFMLSTEVTIWREAQN